MKSNELRIGNFIKDTGGIQHKIRAVFESGIHNENFNGFPYDFIEAIPLTEEWLIKFGANSLFSSDPQDRDASKKFEFKNLTIHMLNENVNEFSFFTYENDCLEIKYVHQLQNLYFALTGKELVYND